MDKVSNFIKSNFPAFKSNKSVKSGKSSKVTFSAGNPAKTSGSSNISGGEKVLKSSGPPEESLSVNEAFTSALGTKEAIGSLRGEIEGGKVLGNSGFTCAVYTPSETNPRPNDPATCHLYDMRSHPNFCCMHDENPSANGGCNIHAHGTCIGHSPYYT